MHCGLARNALPHGAAKLQSPAVHGHTALRVREAGETALNDGLVPAIRRRTRERDVSVARGCDVADLAGRESRRHTANAICDSERGVRHVDTGAVDTRQRAAAGATGDTGIRQVQAIEVGEGRPVLQVRRAWRTTVSVYKRTAGPALSNACPGSGDMSEGGVA